MVATDLHPARARLTRRLVRARNVCVVTAKAEALSLTPKFDRVLADVPCSGTGTLTRNPEIKWRLRPEDLSELHRLQRLKSEGELVWDDLDSLVRGKFLRTLPGVHPCDGFFAAVLEVRDVAS